MKVYVMPRLTTKVSKMATDLKGDLTKKFPVQCQKSYMSKLRIIKNLLILSIGFMFIFSAFMALVNLQSTINNAENIGVMSQSAMYCSGILSTLFLPTLLIKKFGHKMTLVASTLTYLPYIAANFYPTMSTLFPTAVLLGIGGPNLWTAATAYVNELSFLDAGGDAAKAVLSTSRFFGTFTMFFQTTQIWGNLIAYYVLNPTDIASEIYEDAFINKSRDMLREVISCGADFCGDIDQALGPLPVNQRYTLIGIYFAFSIIAALTLLIFLDPLPQYDKGNDESSLLGKTAATFKQIIKTDQLLLVILTTFTGLEQGFVFADYSEAYVACTLGLRNVGLVFVCFGIINSTTAFIAGRLLKYIPRIVMFLTAATSNIGVCIVLLYWRPNIQHTSVFYILVSFWGFSDAIWQTQLNALYGVLFRINEEAVFANYRLWEAVGFVIAFSCSGFLCTTSKIYMQIGFLVAGMTGYVALTIRTANKN